MQIKIKCCYINKDEKGLWNDKNNLFNVNQGPFPQNIYFPTKKLSPQSNFNLFFITTLNLKAMLKTHNKNEI